MFKIWILTSYPPNDEKSVDRDNMVCESMSGGQYENIKLYDEFKKLNFDVRIVNPNEIKIQKTSIAVNNEHVSIIPDIAIIRITRGSDVPNIRLLSKLNIKIVNNIDAHLVCGNKPKQLDILSQHSVDIPKTKINDIFFDDHILNDIVYPIVVKPISSLRGELVELCESPDDIYTHCRKIQIRFPKQKSVIFQEFIKGPTISVWVIGGKPISAQIKYPKPNIKFFVSNREDDGLHSIYEIDNDLYNLTINACKALNVELARIDVLKSYDGYKICEINSPGGFGLRDKAFNANHARDTALYIRGLL